MKKHLLAFFGVALLLTAVLSVKVQAEDPKNTLVITMTNDPVANAVIVVDAATHARLQTLSTCPSPISAAG